MGRQPCCDKVGLKKGPWTAEEDKRLINFILTNGQCCWRAVPKLAGLLRCGKSCRLRWTNYLRPDLKRGLLSEAEEKMVIELHSQLGNRWSKIASHLPGRTDNEIKNHWNTHIKKKLRKMGIDPLTHKPLLSLQEISDLNRSSEEQVDEKTESTDDDDALPWLRRSPGFCIDEVPMIQPHEIVAPCDDTSCSSSCHSSSSVKAEETQLEIPCMEMEWPESTYLWGFDNLNGLDLVLDRGDDKLGLPDPFGQCLRSAFEQESWKFELF